MVDNSNWRPRLASAQSAMLGCWVQVVGGTPGARHRTTQNDTMGHGSWRPSARSVFTPPSRLAGERFGAPETVHPALGPPCDHTATNTRAQDCDHRPALPPAPRRRDTTMHGRGCGTASPSLTSSTGPVQRRPGKTRVAGARRIQRWCRATAVCIYCSIRPVHILIRTPRAQGAAR